MFVNIFFLNYDQNCSKCAEFLFLYFTWNFLPSLFTQVGGYTKKERTWYRKFKSQALFRYLSHIPVKNATDIYDFGEHNKDGGPKLFKPTCIYS